MYIYFPYYLKCRNRWLGQLFYSISASFEANKNRLDEKPGDFRSGNFFQNASGH